MSELRLNQITNEWVVIATDRAKRPIELKQWKDQHYHPEKLDSCPFCPGNESKTPGEIIRINDKDGAWRIRVVPNKLGLMNEIGECKRTTDGIKHRAEGVGRNEIVVESTLHNLRLPDMSVEHISDILGVYQSRFIEVSEDPRVEHVVIFKNYGEDSGTSIIHPHTQIVGLPVMPFQARERMEEATRHYDLTGTCLMCATLEDELKDRTRIVCETEHFVAFVPYASLSPFHMWIFPKRHSATLAAAVKPELSDLAVTLKTAISKLQYGLNDPDYNFVIRSVKPDKCRSEFFHWYVSIVPRLLHSSGFALGSGMYMNIIVPEEAAEFLRNIKIED